MRLDGPAAGLIERFFGGPLRAWAQPEPLARLVAMAS
jgi:hypothetical protein